MKSATSRFVVQFVLCSFPKAVHKKLSKLWRAIHVWYLSNLPLLVPIADRNPHSSTLLRSLGFSPRPPTANEKRMPAERGQEEVVQERLLGRAPRAKDHGGRPPVLPCLAGFDGDGGTKSGTRGRTS